MQVDQRVFQVAHGVDPAVPDFGTHQLGCGARQRVVGLGGNRRPGRMLAAGPLVPGLVQSRERVQRGFELCVRVVARYGTKGTAILSAIGANDAAIKGVIAVAPKLAAVAPYAAQLTVLSKVPPQVFPYLKARAAGSPPTHAGTRRSTRRWSPPN